VNDRLTISASARVKGDWFFSTGQSPFLADIFAGSVSTRRKSEILGLKWPQVDFETGNVCLEPGTTKNREARQFPFTADLREILEAQKEKRDALAKEGKICLWVVFHYGFRKSGKPSRFEASLA
jgi:site-specific recombinase XerC